MPKRTNDFQELVSLIQRALVPEGASITESAMVTTTDGKATREIDILIDSAVGPYRVRVAVEAKKESRKMDQVRFDAIIGKYLQDGGVRVNKIVVVAFSGFTDGVLERAKLLDIELVTLTEAKAVDWSRLKPPEACLRSAVELIETTFDDEVRRAFNDSIPVDARIVCSCGWNYGTPGNYARHVFWRKVLRESRNDLLRFDDEVTTQGSERKLQIAIHPAEPHQIYLEQGDVRVIVREFSFKVRLFKAPEKPLPFAGEIGMSHSPHVCKVKFTPDIPAVDNRQLLDGSKVKCSCCGRDHGTVRQWAHDVALTKFLSRNPAAQKMLREGLQKSPTGHAHLTASWPFPSRYRVLIGEAEHSPQSITIDIHAVAAKGSLLHQQYEMCRSDGTKSRVDSFEGVVAGKRLRLIMPDGLSSKKVVVRIDNAKPNQKLGSKQKRQLQKHRRTVHQRKNSQAAKNPRQLRND